MLVTVASSRIRGIITMYLLVFLTRLKTVGRDGNEFTERTALSTYRPASRKRIVCGRAVSRICDQQSQRPCTAGLSLIHICLTLWLSNIMLEKLGFDGEQLTGREPDPVIVTDIIARAKNTAALAAKVPAEVVVVTNEVGWGLVPENPLARLYRDLVGKVNQAFATAADEVYMLVAGLPLRLK